MGGTCVFIQATSWAKYCWTQRTGLGAAQLMEAPVWDNATLEDLNTVMADASICGLGQAAPNPVDCVVRYFADELVVAA